MEKPFNQKIGDFLIEIIKFYTIGIFWVLLFLSCLYFYDYIRWGFVWHASDRDTAIAAFTIGIPMGFASWLIFKSLKK